jgi:hypothetical protein
MDSKYSVARHDGRSSSNPAVVREGCPHGLAAAVPAGPVATDLDWPLSPDTKITSSLAVTFGLPSGALDRQFVSPFHLPPGRKPSDSSTRICERSVRRGSR